jgi:hypothetical protein
MGSELPGVSNPTIVAKAANIFVSICKPLGFDCAVRVVKEGGAGAGALAAAILGGLLVRAGT